ncbi:hypothetical protein MMC09_003018 [Bachmanniomyces sp. S44760]|nr:hypothetical protein [Bachmanniomyces sp. S44760]
MADVMIIDLSQRQETDEFRELYVSSKKDIERLQSQVKTLEDLGQVQNTVDHDDALKSESEQAEIVNLTEGQVLRNSGGAHADSPDAMSESMELREPKEGGESSRTIARASPRKRGTESDATTSETDPKKGKTTAKRGKTKGKQASKK